MLDDTFNCEITFIRHDLFYYSLYFCIKVAYLANYLLINQWKNLAVRLLCVSDKFFQLLLKNYLKLQKN